MDTLQPGGGRHEGKEGRRKERVGVLKKGVGLIF